MSEEGEQQAAPLTNPTSPSPIITIRAPTAIGGTSTTTSSSSGTFEPPPLSWLVGTWHVTHSTLPMWKNSRNVAITYKTLGSSSDEDPSSARLDDVVSYQGLSSAKWKTISGIDSPAGPGAWNWRGRGWLMFVSSRWEILGYGGEEAKEEDEEDEDQWVVTYFAKTLFTPAGIDIYSRMKKGLTEGTLAAIKEALGKVQAEVVRKLAGELFEVKSEFVIDERFIFYDPPIDS